jgi:hypothetical protein
MADVYGDVGSLDVLSAHWRARHKRPCIDNEPESTLELVERLSGHVSAWLRGGVMRRRNWTNQQLQGLLSGP